MKINVRLQYFKNVLMNQFEIFTITLCYSYTKFNEYHILYLKGKYLPPTRQTRCNVVFRVGDFSSSCIVNTSRKTHDYWTADSTLVHYQQTELVWSRHVVITNKKHAQHERLAKPTFVASQNYNLRNDNDTVELPLSSQRVSSSAAMGVHEGVVTFTRYCCNGMAQW